jgi:hypothetical protein
LHPPSSENLLWVTERIFFAAPDSASRLVDYQTTTSILRWIQANSCRQLLAEACQ